MFWAAFGSMLSRFEEESRDRAVGAEATDIVQLSPPPAARPTVPAPVIVRQPPKVPATPAAVENRTDVPTTTATEVVPSAAATPSDARAEPSSVPLDSGGVRASARGIARAIPSGGAPMAPAGVTRYSGASYTQHLRDSILRASMLDVPYVAKHGAPRAAAREEIELGQRQADMVQRRATTVGNSRDVIILHGNAIGGAGVVGAGGSVGLPLFSSGPSAAQRKKDAVVETDNWLRLGRLQDRMYLKRDSIRADSLRRDSLAKKKNVP